MMLAKQGHSVVLFEKDELGGTCLNKGCIPTKSLIHSSEIYSQLVNSAAIGIDLTINNFDFIKIAEKRDNAVLKIRKSLELAVKNSGVNVIYAEAKIKDKNTIIADNNEYNINNIIVATGSKPREVKGLEFDGKFILSSEWLAPDWGMNIGRVNIPVSLNAGFRCSVPNLENSESFSCFVSEL